MSEPIEVVDEWIYTAADHDDEDRIVLVSGLTILRHPDQFEPISTLNRRTEPGGPQR